VAGGRHGDEHTVIGSGCGVKFSSAAADPRRLRRNTRQQENDVPYFELQIGQEEFVSIVEMAASRMTNPIATLGFLPTGALVSGIQYTSGQIQLSEVVDGVAVLHAPVSVTYTSFAAYEADPTSQGQTFPDPTSVEIHVGFVGLKLQVSVVAVLEMASMQRYALPSPAIVQSIDLGQLLSGIQDVPLNLGAVVWQGDIVAARVGDGSLTVSSLGQIGGILRDPIVDQRPPGPGGWALVLSGQLLAEIVTNQFHDQLSAQMADPNVWDSNVSVEKWPSVQWGQSPNQPNVFGLAATFTLRGYGVSVDVNAFIDFTGNAAITSQHPNASIDLVVHVTHHTSSGDVAFLELLAILSGGAVPVLGWAVVVLLPGVIYSLIDGKVANQQLTALTKQSTPDPGDDATFTGAIALPSILNSPPDAVDVNSAGVIATGTLPIPALAIAATHSPQVSPTAIDGAWGGHYDCQSQGWTAEYDVPPVFVTDLTTFPVLGTSSQPAKIFDVDVVPGALWLASPLPAPGGVQVTPADGLPNTGDSGTLYLHTSAGMVSVPINPVPNEPPGPTPAELAQAQASCELAAAAWPSHFDLHWLIDPGPYENVLRLWMIEINTISAGTSLQIDDHTHAPAVITAADINGGMQFVTAPTDTVSVAVIGEGGVTASLHQRLLTVDATFDLGADVVDLALAPAGNVVAVTSDAIISFDGQMRPAVRTETNSTSTQLAASATAVRNGSQATPGLGRQFLTVRRGFVLVADGTNVHLTRPVRTLTNVGL
jgi:hypothetical protein